MSLRALRCAHAALLPALALLPLCACSGNRASASIDSIFDHEAAWRHLEHIVGFGPRPSGSEALARQVTWMEAELSSYGLTPVRETFTEETPVGPIEFTNLYVDLRGEGEDLPLVVLGSHYDTFRKEAENGFVGANDGGSSTAVLLELARCLASVASDRRIDYRLLFLDGEEPQSMSGEWSVKWGPDRDRLDNRYGSRHHVEALRQSGELDRTACFVLLDMVGDVELRLFSERYSDPVLLGMIFDAAKANGLREYVGGPYQEVKDDHLSFAEAGVPSVDLIDLYFGGPANPWWHEPDKDVLSNCSRESLRATGRIVLYALPAIEDWAVRRAARR